VELNVWRTSSRSGSNGQCVEVKTDGKTVYVRDTKNRNGGTLTFTTEEWSAFTGGVNDGDFDR